MIIIIRELSSPNSCRINLGPLSSFNPILVGDDLIAHITFNNRTNMYALDKLNFLVSINIVIVFPFEIASC